MEIQLSSPYPLLRTLAWHRTSRCGPQTPYNSHRAEKDPSLST